MPKTEVTQGSAYHLEEGDFLALLREVEDRRVPFTYKSHHKAVQRGDKRAGEEGEVHKWKWVWELLEGPNAGAEVPMETQPTIELEGWSPGRVAYEALIGEPLLLGQDIDTDLVVGGKARIVLTHQAPRNADGRTFYDTRITDILPAKDGDESRQYQEDEPPF